MRIITVSHRWTLTRGACVADVSCDVADLLDDDDAHYLQIRVALNELVFYTREYVNGHDVEHAVAETLSDLLAAGWQPSERLVDTTGAYIGGC
jgi:hypothetical protein